MKGHRIIWVIGNHYHNADYAVNPETHWIHWLPDNCQVKLLTKENFRNVDAVNFFNKNPFNKYGMPHLIYVSFTAMDITDSFEFYPDDNWNDYKAPFESRVNWQNASVKEVATVDSVLKIARVLGPTVYTMDKFLESIQIPEHHIMTKSLAITKMHAMSNDLLNKSIEDISEADYKQFAQQLIEEIN